MKLCVSMRRKLIFITLPFILFSGALCAASKPLDVLVVYTDTVSNVSQGKDIPAIAASFVEFANQAYANSDANLRLRLVRVEKISLGADTGVSSNALTSLARGPAVADLRSKYGADLVSLLTVRTDSGGGFFCGIGYLPRGRDGQFYSYAKNSAYSVSAVNCGHTTFAHEVGHNQGLGHSYVQGSTGGIYPWARGHGVRDEFVTIMAYPHAYGRAARVQQFSSPAQVKCLGLACGVDPSQPNGADSVSNLNIVALQMADYFPTKVKDTTVDQGSGDDGGSNNDGSNDGTDNGGDDNGGSNGGTDDGGDDNGGSNGGTDDGGDGNGGSNGGADDGGDDNGNKYNLIVNGSFDSLEGWRPFFNRGELEQSTIKYDTQFALRVTSRRSRYAGPIQSVPLEPGKTYDFSAYATLATSHSARSPVYAAIMVRQNRRYRGMFIARQSVVKGQWSRLASRFTVPNYKNARSIEFLVFGPRPQRDFLLDEVSVTEVE